MFKHRFVAQNIAVNLGGLVDNARVRNRHNYSCQLFIGQGVSERKGKAASCFPSTRGTVRR